MASSDESLQGVMRRIKFLLDHFIQDTTLLDLIQTHEEYKSWTLQEKSEVLWTLAGG
jgi:hypothetical protein